MKRIPAVIVVAPALAFRGGALATPEIHEEFEANGSTARGLSDPVARMPKKKAAQLNDLGRTVPAAEGRDRTIHWTKVTHKAPTPGVAP